MVWEITKEFSFEYGHRVYTQQLDFTMALTTLCKCRHLHGHTGTVKVHLSNTSLNKQSMVTDFTHLAWFKKFLDDELDHKMILDINDPYLDFLKQEALHNQATLVPHALYKLWRIQETSKPPYSYLAQRTEAQQTALNEVLDGTVIVDFVPTSERLAQWLTDIVADKFPDLTVSVTFSETAKTSSTYTRTK